MTGPALIAATVPGVPGAEPAAPDGRWALSINPARTFLGLAFLAGLTLFFTGTCRALAAVRASTVVRGVIAVGVIVALIAIVQAASDSPRVYGVWWPRKVETPPAAPLINHNHLAGWLLMAFSLAAAYLCSGFAGGRFSRELDWRRRLRWFASREGSLTLLAGLSAFVIAVSVIVTRSVSGIAGFLAVCFVLSRCLRRRARDAPIPFLVRIALIALPVAAIAWVGFGVVGGEVAAASWSDIGGRVPIWQDTLRIVRDFPVTGTGWNTYGIAMLAYQTGRPEVHVVEAHSDYLQLGRRRGRPGGRAHPVCGPRVRPPGALPSPGGSRRCPDLLATGRRRGRTAGARHAVARGLQFADAGERGAVHPAPRHRRAPRAAADARRRRQLNAVRVAFDLDGVLADFAGAFTAIARRRLPPPANSVLGLSEADPSADAVSPSLERHIWREIRSTENFWTTLDPLEPGLIAAVHDRAARDRWDTFFVTQRPDTAGDSVQRQTQRWLAEQGFPLPSVIVHRGSRGRLAAALELDFLVDDTVAHCVDVLDRSRTKPIFICRKPDAVAETNAQRLGITTCRSVTDALRAIGH